MSPWISGFIDITVAMTCTSLRKCSGKSGRIGLAAFALEEATRDAAAGVELLDVVDGEREEVHAFARILVADRRHQHDRVAELHDDCATSLAGDFARLEGDLVLTVLERLGYFRHDL
jgi:hypothetical protein